MLKCLIGSFQRSLVLNQSTVVDTNQKCIKHLVRAVTTNAASPLTSQSDSALENPLDSDEYIVPYRIDHESRLKNNNFVIEALQTRFRLNKSDIQKVLSDGVVHRTYKRNFLSRSLDLLCNYGITRKTILENPWLITLDPKRLDLKLQDLSVLNLRDINDFAPLLCLTYPRFNKLLTSMRRESKYVPHGNRVYYISEQLQLSPTTVTKFLSKRLFILEMPFDMLNQNLNNMLRYNVSPMNILRDLWAFRYTPKSVETRLERAKRAKKDKIMPWMVRCPENILQKSFKLSIEEDQILGERDSAVAYIAERLGFTIEQTHAILSKHPSVFKVRAPKIKKVLDYLLDEAHFTRYDIANVPRILCHSLETTKARIEELKSLGCRPSSLVIVCRSKREYAKFINSWTDVRDKMESSNSKVNEE